MANAFQNQRSRLFPAGCRTESAQHNLPGHCSQALGGGTVRHLLLGNFPVTWTQRPRNIYLTITVARSPS
ncbi:MULTISPECIES: TRIC cation channel family protein [Marinobacter]|uniref:TRIC cation channel family protein n=1 Tax=Marinobacter aromaticivorans TaxID=1494078 RepID=A0ABW2J0C7_9GAMM|nr:MULTISPECIES: TRIC cation channel family protein [Marinobacter]MCG2580476.1 TRIC cation channel family protein [Marinobacter sp.]WOI17950.1 TRIC cation channel family protein [Marinobacter salarius]